MLEGQIFFNLSLNSLVLVIAQFHRNPNIVLSVFGDQLWAA